MVITADRDAGRMNLGVARVGNVGSSLMGTESGHDITAHGVG